MVSTANGLTTQEFVREVNNERLQNKNRWITWFGKVNGKEVSLKSHNNWVQVILVDGVKKTGNMYSNVSEFKQFLKEAVA